MVTIQELINYYRTHNLRECFDTLNTQLREPLRGHKFYRAMHNYEATEEKFLSLKKDDIVTLIDTQGEQLGWWRGQIGNRVRKKNSMFEMG